MLKSKKIIVFASGSGYNFVSIFSHIQNGQINGEFVLLVSDKRNCGAIEFAKKNDIEVLSIQNKTFLTKYNIHNWNSANNVITKSYLCI